MDNYKSPELILYQHPLASFCHKVLIALYENGIRFESHFVDLMLEDVKTELYDFWPVGKIPLLRDLTLDKTIPETSIIIEYIDLMYPGKTKLIPNDTNLALLTRLWDRFFDLYVSEPMQKIVLNQILPDGDKDRLGVGKAYSRLRISYSMIEKQLESKKYLIGENFTMADCSAIPALFYSDTIVSFRDHFPKLTAYFELVLGRDSVKRTLSEAEPYFSMYPFFEKIPKRFLKDRI
ncbi:glutathione S-transferase family protein [Leptospira sp. WS39.C2]